MADDNRQKTGAVNVYVAIGQLDAKIARLVDRIISVQTIIATARPMRPPCLLGALLVQLWVNISVITAAMH